jgi:hypothetical protein
MTDRSAADGIVSQHEAGGRATGESEPCRGAGFGVVTLLAIGAKGSEAATTPRLTSTPGPSATYPCDVPAYVPIAP